MRSSTLRLAGQARRDQCVFCIDVSRERGEPGRRARTGRCRRPVSCEHAHPCRAPHLQPRPCPRSSLHPRPHPHPHPHPRPRPCGCATSAHAPAPRPRHVAHAGLSNIQSKYRTERRRDHKAGHARAGGPACTDSTCLSPYTRLLRSSISRAEARPVSELMMSRVTKRKSEVCVRFALGGGGGGGGWGLGIGAGATRSACAPPRRLHSPAISSQLRRSVPAPRLGTCRASQRETRHRDVECPGYTTAGGNTASRACSLLQLEAHPSRP